MKVLITAPLSPLGRSAASLLAGEHTLVPVEDDAYLLQPETVDRLLAGSYAVLHLLPHTDQPAGDPRLEGAAIERASRGTYVLLQAAARAGVRRFVMASRLDLFRSYPPEAAVDEQWKPQPEATASGLLPYLCELTVREFVRVHPMVGVCLRFGALGPGPEQTTPEDAAAALGRALAMETPDPGYHWWLFHVGSGSRYPPGSALRGPLSFRPSGGGA